MTLPLAPELGAGGNDESPGTGGQRSLKARSISSIARMLRAGSWLGRADADRRLIRGGEELASILRLARPGGGAARAVR